MEKENKFWLVRDKRRLLLVMMEKLAGGAHISFEGDLSALRLSDIPGASQEETGALKRNTLWPKQDFITGHPCLISTAIQHYLAVRRLFRNA